MPDAFAELLEAAIHHLKELQGRGVRFVSVSSEALSALSTGPRPGSASQPVKHSGAPAASGSNSSLVSYPTAPAAPDRPAPSMATQPARANAAPGPSSAAPFSVPDAAAKAVAFEALRQRAMACVKCPHLVAARRNVVFGVGSLNAELMFVGEAPGSDEDQHGEPFVGKAGQLLTKIIQTMGLSRDSVYIANILKCRPDTPGQAAGNRKPTPEEMQTCIPYLHEQIDLIGPKVLVALGGTAVEGLLGKTIGITRLRGSWRSYRGIPLMPTYHPAYLLRNQALSEKRRLWEDMLQVMDKLALPISEKQRKYFSNAS